MYEADYEIRGDHSSLVVQGNVTEVRWQMTSNMYSTVLDYRLNIHSARANDSKNLAYVQYVKLVFRALPFQAQIDFEKFVQIGNVQ